MMFNGILNPSCRTNSNVSTGVHKQKKMEICRSKYLYSTQQLFPPTYNTSCGEKKNTLPMRPEVKGSPGGGMDGCHTCTAW